MERIVYNYAKLKGRIIEKCGSQKVFAEKLGISEGTLTSKLSCYTYFNQNEILLAIRILDIKEVDVTAYFFTVKV